MSYTNWCYAYQFNVYNAFIFDTATKGLNNVFYGGCSDVGCMGSGFAAGLRKVGCALPRFHLLGGHCCGCGPSICFGVIANYAYNLDGALVRDPHSIDNPIRLTKFGRWISPVLLYSMWGISDALCQCW